MMACTEYEAVINLPVRRGLDVTASGCRTELLTEYLHSWFIGVSSRKCVQYDAGAICMRIL